MEILLSAPTTSFPVPEIAAVTENTCTTSDNVACGDIEKRQSDNEIGWQL